MSDNSETTNVENTPEAPTDGAVQVNAPTGDVTVNTGGQEAVQPGGARVASDEAK